MKTTIPLLAIGGALLLSGCYTEHHVRHTSARGPIVEVSYAYVYYPDVEVYYHPQRHLYYWADGGTWRSGARVPRNYVLRSGVTVTLDSPEPYRHHEEVRGKHPRPHEDKDRGHNQQDRRGH